MMEFQSLQGQPMSLNANIPSFYAQGCECGVKGLGYQLNVHVVTILRLSGDNQFFFHKTGGLLTD